MQINQLPVATSVALTDSLAIDNSNGTTKKITAEMLIASVRSGSYGAPLVASTVAGMTNTSRVYVYTGSETGYTAGHWYYYNGSAWADGGAYNSSTVHVTATLVENDDYNIAIS